ncbi:MAG: TonB-dependent receptor [Bacteroidia bacterium]
MHLRIIFVNLIGFIFLIAFTHELVAQGVFDQKIKTRYYEEPLSLVLINLEINYQIKFEYDKEKARKTMISTRIINLPIKEAMAVMLQGTGLGFELKAPNTIVISKDLELPGEKLEDVLKPSELEPERTDFTASGIIRDVESGETLPYATLKVVGSPIGTNSNNDGWFTLLKVPSDTSLLQVSYIGYRTKHFRLTPDLNMEELIIGLSPINRQLDEVLIVGANEDQMMKASTGISKISVSPAQLVSIPSLGEKDIFRSLQLLPGVSGSNESSSGLYVRGGTPDQNLVLFDGFTVYHVDHLFGFFSAFNSNAIKDVQLYKGGFESKYGGRLSSVVDITGKDGNSEHVNLGAGISLLSANAFAEIPFAKGKGTILVAGRRSFQSGFYNNLLEFSDGDSDTGTGDDNTTTTQPGPPGGFRGFASVEPESWFYDLNAKATYRTEKDIYSFSFYNGKDHLDNSRYADENTFRGGPFGGGNTENTNFSFSQDIIDNSNWGNTGASLKWSRKWNNKLYSSLLASGSNYFSYRDRGVQLTIERDSTTEERNTGTIEDNNLLDYSLKWDWEWQLAPNHKMSFGSFGSAFDIQYDFTQNDTTTILSRNDQGLLTGTYLQIQSGFWEKLMVTPGIRINYFGETGKLYYEPRLQAQWFPHKNLKIKAAAGRYYQFANRIIREDISQGSRDFWILSDGNSVPVGVSDHLIVGMGYETPNYLFDVEAYYKSLDGITEYSTRFVLNGFGRESSLDFEENFYNGTGVAKGIELLAQKKSGKLTGWISYTLGEVAHQFDVYGDKPFLASHNTTHELKIVSTYRLGKWSFGGTFVYASGKPYTAPLGAYSVELLDENTADHFAVSSKNSLFLPDYHRLDLSANYDFERFLGGKATAGLSLFNVYNRSNVWYKEFDVIDGVILETDVNFLGFTPSVYFTWTLK